MNGQDARLKIIAAEIEKAVRKRRRELYSPRALAYIENPVNLGVVEGANGFGLHRGLCGDTMKIYLRLEAGTIREAKFQTDGCEATVAAGGAVIDLCREKTLAEALAISPAAVLESLGNFPADHVHCAILAANSLMNALANYLILNG